MKIIITTGRKRKITVLIDDEDEPLYRSRTWASHWRKGLCCTKTRDYLHRLILKAPVNRGVRHVNGNKFDCRKVNLALRNRGVTYSRGRPRKQFVRGARPDGSISGVNRYTPQSRNKTPYYGVKFAFRGELHQGHFSTVGFRTPEISESEAHRRAVCWRIGMMLQHDLLPDKQSMELFESLHPQLCPYPQRFTLSYYEGSHVWHTRFEVNGKKYIKNFCTLASIEEGLRKAVLWRIGILFCDVGKPDAESVGALKRIITAEKAIPASGDELYAGNAEYRGNPVYGEEDDYFNTASRPQREYR